MELIAKWFISALSLLGAAFLIPGISVESFYSALIAALFLGLLNALIRPILVILTLPITVVTLGLFIFIINGFLFWFLSSFIKGFYVDGLFSAIIGAIIVSIFSWIGNQFIVNNQNNYNAHTKIHHR
ncbi:phage holin family protein [Patescibacteria group bacterium]|nr:phage holin family protein [Patescibacteria group bacterium]MBU1247041.1 phage holin family protein [Patescibacteria group bacterium]MBU1519742.1 phage holin family protein [Patescibacteria group bacterium]MBU1730241.1 phage holin family protein [Patescibacteria group bacterium]MBU1956498.1 phage holin family protein [Patescibacteria group bacterium]